MVFHLYFFYPAQEKGVENYNKAQMKPTNIFPFSPVLLIIGSILHNFDSSLVSLCPNCLETTTTMPRQLATVI